MMPPKTEEQVIEIGDSHLWSISTGAGTPVLFLNGGPGCDDYLEPVARLIDDEYRVIRFEPRGCGRSSWDGRYDLETCLLDIEQVRKAYGCERWIILGHSHGPNLALAYALRYPSRTMGVIGISGGKIVDDRAWSQTYHERLDTIGEDNGDKEFHADSDMNRAGNADWRAFCRQPSLLFDLANLKVPCIFINAGADIRPNWPTQQLAALIPGAHYIEIEGAAHTIWLTHAAELQVHLREALDNIANPGVNEWASSNSN